MTQRKLVLIELNEVNFEYAREYLGHLRLPNFTKLFETGVTRTTSEARYEELEPWIQWVSAHTGLTAAEHQVFRLGDMVSSAAPQLYEQLEAAGVSVGAISPMNTVNRLKSPAYFLPDAWTRTATDGSFWSRILADAISQAINDNSSQRVTAKSALALLVGLARFASPRNYAAYLKLALRSRGAPWRKALFLDLFLNDLHGRLLRSRRPSFSSLFLNAGAHIQHHYFFNSRAVDNASRRNPAWYVPADVDPFGEMLVVYDRILGDYLADEGTDIIVATGLTQRPYDRVKFYYRLRDHGAFLRAAGIPFKNVEPRMTRDFLIEFESVAQADEAEAVLSKLRSSVDDLPLFGEIDNRGLSLFVTLTYPHEIRDNLEVQGLAQPMKLQQHVTFVAIKNGMHDASGFVWSRGDIRRYAPADGAHVKQLHSAILAFFGLTAPPATSLR
jgi:hypothetical protein